jgi:hypothetical protein
MKIVDVYQKYKIMPQLQEHQFRVSAVAKQICGNLNVKVDAPAIITACLLHDMANILKFDLTVFPDFLEPQGLDYWQKVKDDYLKKYKTPNVHTATLDIIRELGMPKRVIELAGAVGFRQAADNAHSQDMGRKICAYSDMRVGPYGVISLEDRLIDGAKRYEGKIFDTGQRQDEFASALRQIEGQIFSLCEIKPPDITDESSAEIIGQLKSYEI